MAATSTQSSSGDTPGVVRAATWYLRNSNSTGTADIRFSYGNPGGPPVAGNWPETAVRLTQSCTHSERDVTIGVQYPEGWHVNDPSVQPCSAFDRSPSTSSLAPTSPGIWLWY